jgi:hypothetical protein
MDELPFKEFPDLQSGVREGAVYPDAHLEMRQGARIILKSKEEPSQR